MIDAGDACLLGAERVVGSDDDLILTGRCDVDRVFVRGNIDDRTEVVVHSGSIVDGAGCGEDAAVARIDLSGGVEAACERQAGKGRLWSKREADVGVIECG